MEDYELAEIIEAATFYRCLLCKSEFSDKNVFVTHFKTHISITNEIDDENIDPVNCIVEETIEERFLCSFCYHCYHSVELVREHMIKEHDFVPIENETNIVEPELQLATKTHNELSNNKEEIVTSSDDQLLRPISLKELKKRLTKSFIIKCSIRGCVYSFESKENRAFHEKCHVSTSAEQIKLFKCAECQATAKNWRNCSMHMWKEHNIDIDLLKCPFCVYKAALTVQIYRHLQIHGATKGFACSDCSKTFKQFSQLRVHAITHFDTKKRGPRWYSEKNCDICGNVFANSKILSKHIKTVHNKIKPFICAVCGHKSARKSSWLIHMRQHTNEKPLACKYCDFRSADPSVMKKHELRHTKKNNGDAPYQCTDCNYSSIQSSSLKTHLKKYHPTSYKSIRCDKCTFVSINKDILKRHMRDHQLGLIINEDSNENDPNTDTVGKLRETVTENLKRNVEISSDCFLPLDTDSLAHDHTLDTGGVTIPAQHSEETQFPCFMNS